MVLVKVEVVIPAQGLDFRLWLFPSAERDPAPGRPCQARSAAAAPAGYTATASTRAHCAAAAAHCAAANCTATHGAAQRRAAPCGAARAAPCGAACAASAAAAAALCNLQDFARLDVLLIEDIKCRQADVD